METARSRPGLVPLGELVAALGALVLLGSLWRPWYELRFPEELLSQARALAPRMGEMGGYVNQGIDQLRAAGALPVTAWQAFEQADLVLAGAAGLALVIVALNLTGALTQRLDGLIALAGAVAVATVLYRLVSPPGSDLPGGGDLLHPATALYAGLAGAALVLTGGLMAMGAPESASRPPEPVATRPAQGDVKVWEAS